MILAKREELAQVIDMKSIRLVLYEDEVIHEIKKKIYIYIRASCFFSHRTILQPEILTCVRCPIGFSFVHHTRRAVQERTITNVRMPDNPSHIGCHPPYRIFIHSVNRTHGPTKRHEVSSDRPYDPLRLSWYTNIVIAIFFLLITETLRKGLAKNDHISF